MPSSRHSCRGSKPSRGVRTLCAMPLMCLIAIASLSGCGGVKVLVSQSGSVVRAGPDLTGKVYVWNGTEWELSANTVRIPEGWYIASIDDEGGE